MKENDKVKITVVDHAAEPQVPEPPRMGKSHSKRHEPSFGGTVSVVIVITTPPQ